MDSKMSFKNSDTGEIYEIKVLGELDEGWQNWFNGLEVTLTHTSKQSPTTTMTGRVTDQAALRGMLCKLWDLNLTLISLRRLEANENKEDENE